MIARAQRPATGVMKRKLAGLAPCRALLVRHQNQAETFLGLTSRARGLPWERHLHRIRGAGRYSGGFSETTPRTFEYNWTRSEESPPDEAAERGLIPDLLRTLGQLITDTKFHVS